MSSSITSPSRKKDAGGATSSPSGPKGKAPDALKISQEKDDDEDGDDDEDDEDGDEEMNSGDEEEEEVEDNFDEIDPTAIKSRRTRGVRVDYTSSEALEKAGLKPEDLVDDEEMKD